MIKYGTWSLNHLSLLKGEYKEIATCREGATRIPSLRRREASSPSSRSRAGNGTHTGGTTSSTWSRSWGSWSRRAASRMRGSRIYMGIRHATHSSQILLKYWAIIYEEEKLGQFWILEVNAYTFCNCYFWIDNIHWFFLLNITLKGL